jgi:hypothetical protein
MIVMGYPLVSAMCSILFHSICFCCGLGVDDSSG